MGQYRGLGREKNKGATTTLSFISCLPPIIYMVLCGWHKFFNSKLIFSLLALGKAMLLEGLLYGIVFYCLSSLTTTLTSTFFVMVEVTLRPSEAVLLSSPTRGPNAWLRFDFCYIYSHLLFQIFKYRLSQASMKGKEPVSGEQFPRCSQSLVDDTLLKQTLHKWVAFLLRVCFFMASNKKHYFTIQVL